MVAANFNGVRISDDIRADKSLEQRVERANEILVPQFAKSAEVVDAGWGLRSDDSGRPLVELRLSDSTGTVEGSFAPHELDDPAEVRRRILWLWGDLLQVRSHRHLERLNAMIAEGLED